MLAALLAPMSTASAQEVPAGTYVADADSAAFEASATFPESFVTERYWGVSDGAEYRIEVPPGWNGDLVTYSHGFVSPLVSELEADLPPLRDLFLAQGFAWASSSYSANGYVIPEGIAGTIDLLDLFATRTGEVPGEVLATGVSMGGHIVGAMIEQYPDTFVGALPACGVMGDVALYDYFLSHAAAAQTLAGLEDTPVPAPDDYLTDVVPQIKAALGYGPGVSLTDAGHQLSAVTENLTGGERPLFDEAFEFWSDTAAISGLPFLLGVYGGALTGGPATAANDYAGTTGTTYQLDDRATLTPTEIALNEAVPDVTPTGEPPFPEITGTLGTATKVLTIHTIGDLFVPFSMQQVYLEEAIAQGSDDRLVQRAIRDVGHCTFSGGATGEFATAFGDLVTWVRGGAKPAGDDILDPAVVSDQDFGCAFTTGTTATRGLVPPCGALERIAGTDRIRTAVDLVDETYETAPTVVLARADAYADALAAAPLAGRLDAPVLLTAPDALPGAVARQLEVLGTTDVVVMGGPVAVSDAVLASLTDMGVTSRRVAGADRYATAALAAAEVGGDSAFVVLGTSADPLRGWPDAVSVAALAAYQQVPVLLVEQNAVPSATAAAVRDLDIATATVVGGSAAVSDDVLTDLEVLGADVSRVSGQTRYGTSAAISELALGAGMTLDTAYLVTGRGFADALVAGPAAAGTGSLLLLVDEDPASVEPTVALLRDRAAEVGELVVVGGTSAVSAAVAAAVQGLVE